MRGRTAHRKELAALDGVDLTAHQVNDVISNKLSLAAIPFDNGQFGKHIKVFVITVDEQRRERHIRQPVKPMSLSRRTVPNAAEVAANDQIVLRRGGENFST